MTNKVFGIGLSRTGTYSLTKAMRKLGYLSIHYSMDLKQMQHFDFASDITVAWRFKFLDYYFPGSKFVLTVRDEQSWVKSMKEHFKKLGKPEDITIMFERFSTYGSGKFDEDLYIAAYRNHIKAVYKHFEHRQNDLLTMNIIEGDGWKKLCPFLGKKPLSKAFPHYNISLTTLRSRHG